MTRRNLNRPQNLLAHAQGRSWSMSEHLVLIDELTHYRHGRRYCFDIQTSKTPSLTFGRC